MNNVEVMIIESYFLPLSKADIGDARGPIHEIIS